MVQAYIHDDNNDIDFREAHNSGKSVSIEDLEKIGVFYKYCATVEDVDVIAKERNYKNRDVVNISKESFGNENNMMEKLNMFYSEHLHEDEEIRYCLDGSGYFDLRAQNDTDWIRCRVNKGDLLVVPAGIYHRFTLTTENYIKALRLFKDEPKWNAIKRPDGDSYQVREEYLSQTKA
ncbi:hypothetical protein TPHA_0H02500 [Tetrapisispora phaffii CBS 4417]|uniref:Acireductone dioxygenase n=1 Tax=Tetrapisispora phaffii (strain ATCC 24235 / CBS 4417 / NBRC 1672 / NRRL Y-8282 / UCD 70-5) TaxID=1071381 RepID=G8BWK2_TETPH|nr:hypothetical protein TPHA_0H02500 [Tetrapisispora phaffii CBS 4417]CCE64453.1 hypothetical protein TPHA_0H02500 [Tetrapisispora phaffii CBS 4417]